MLNEEQPADRWRHKVQVGANILDLSEILKDCEVKKLNEKIDTPKGNNIEQLKCDLKELEKGEIEELKKQTRKYREQIEPWLGVLLQADHLNLLIGNGLTTAIATQVGIKDPISMSTPELDGEYSGAIQKAAKIKANSSGHTEPNIEHVIHVVHELIQGLQVASMEPNTQAASMEPNTSALLAAKALELANLWSGKRIAILKTFFDGILKTEREIHRKFMKGTDEAESGQRLLESFLLTFANRTATRERLHVFTTNYDRLIEFGADLLGLRILDRFVGELRPVFRASRLGIDMYYNPPGVRGEPRHLEGVMRMTKLHGSIDWKHVGNAKQQNQTGNARQHNQIVRVALPFGAESNHSNVPTREPDAPSNNESDAPSNRADRLMIYPNAAKDIETVVYPYAELFRDFATAVCQPNTVLVTYGYGFGDDHINRILEDMLTIPSTHIVILSFDDAKGKIPKFCRHVRRDEQISLLIGPHFGDLKTLVDHYLPKPIIDHINWKRVERINRSQLYDQRHIDTGESKDT